MASAIWVWHGSPRSLASRPPAGKLVDLVRPASLVEGVVLHGDRVGCRRLGPRRGRILALVQHRPEDHHRPPGRRAPSRHWLRNAGRQHPVADLVGNRKTPRPVRADQHRNLDGPSRTEARRLQHPQHRAFPLDRLAPKKCPQHPDILSHLRPSHRPLPEHHPAGETRPYPDSHPTRGQLGQPGDRRRPSCHLHRDSDVTSAGA
jgi:hypothetical protein